MRYSVALRAGAWIEITPRTPPRYGLPVALRAGAWIEITHIAPPEATPDVALRAGAWIEIPCRHLTGYSAG